MATIVLLEGIVEVEWDGESYRPHILRKGGYEARNPGTGKMVVVEDKLLPHECYSSDLRFVVKYAAKELAASEIGEGRVSLKEWLSLIDSYKDKMMESLKQIKE